MLFTYVVTNLVSRIFDKLIMKSTMPFPVVMKLIQIKKILLR